MKEDTMIKLRETHPNPQCIRKDFILLDGEWDFCFDEESIGLKSEYYKGSNWGSPKTINVPYCYQSPRSGIGIVDEVSTIWYRRNIDVPQNFKDKKILFHIEASDYETTVFVNGQSVGSHVGGNMPFSFDITEYSKIGTNIIAIRVKDNSSVRFPMGKQSYTNKNFGCWYTRTTGIWQSIWIEALPQTYIKRFRFIPHVFDGEIEVIAEIEGRCSNNALFSIEMSCDVGEPHKEISINRKLSTEVHNNLVRFRLSVNDIRFEIPTWSPQNPRLCNSILTLKSNDGEDSVLSYFGFRDVHIKDMVVCLNDRPYYQKLILNQGYYGDGLLTGTDEEFIHDIKMIKEMGFNGMRMHQKTESRRFLYHADRMGLLYWAELASPYSFDPFASVNILNEIQDMVLIHANSPSVVAWTPFNESWGIDNILKNKREQQITIAAREMIHALDYERRPVISNDGWEHTKSDIFTIHDYCQDADAIRASYSKKPDDFTTRTHRNNCGKQLFAYGYKYNGEPIHISEYGGIGFEVTKYSDSDWGYGQTAKTKEEFYKRYEAIHRAYFDIDYITGLCYTQLTDVQQEINGLLDANHKPKFDNKKIADIMNLKNTI